MLPWPRTKIKDRAVVLVETETFFLVEGERNRRTRARFSFALVDVEVLVDWVPGTKEWWPSVPVAVGMTVAAGMKVVAGKQAPASALQT